MAGIVSAPRSPWLQDRVRQKLMQYDECVAMGGVDPLGDFVNNQIESKKWQEKQATKQEKLAEKQERQAAKSPPQNTPPNEY